MSTSVSISQTLATAGKDQLNGLITTAETNPFQNSTIPLVGTLHAGLGPTMPEANTQINQAFRHGSRPLPVIFRSRPINCTELQTTSHHEVAVQSGGVWPIVQQDALEWYEERLEIEEHLWRNARIFDLIKLTFTLCPKGGNRCVLMPLACFWNSSANAFDFKFGQASITLLDMYAGLGFPLGEKPFHEPEYEHVPKVRYNRLPSAWGNFVERFRLEAFYDEEDQGETADAKGVAFLDFWLNKFIFSSTAGKITKTYHRMAEVLYDGNEIGLGQIVLAHLYRCLHTLSCNPLACKISGPLWILEAWSRIYFPLLAPTHHQKTPDEHVVAARQAGTIPNKQNRYYDCLKHIFETIASEFYSAGQAMLDQRYPHALRSGFMSSATQSVEGRRL